MQLYLIRHADAVPGNAELADADRPLSDKGRAQVQALAQALQRVGISFDKVVTSPLLRTRQTAEGLRQGLQLPLESLLACDELAPGGSSKKLAKFLRQVGAEKVAVVGHEPDMGEHAAWLIGSRKAQIEFAKAAVACIACENRPERGGGILQWLATPEVLSGEPKRQA